MEVNMPHFTKALNHASDYWYRPCADGVVRGANGIAINIANEFSFLKLNPSSYSAVFLNYDRSYKSGASIAEGLYIVPSSSASIGKLCSYNAQEKVNIVSDFPVRFFLCSFPDGLAEPDSDPEKGGLYPRYAGLDDCAHFLSECLHAERTDVPVINWAPALVAHLRNRHDTMTLADLVQPDNAQRIISSGVVKPGDAIFFGTRSDNIKYHHSTLFVNDSDGGGLVSCHTWSNHPQLWKENNHYNWRIYVNSTTHTHITIIHFADHGELDNSASSMPGWWTISSIPAYYYFFEKSGRVLWFRQPQNIPAARPDNIGHWFENWDGIRICWRDTGTFEHFVRGVSATGTFDDVISNGIKVGSAVKGIM
jgi:hypothetical protein